MNHGDTGTPRSFLCLFPSIVARHGGSSASVSKGRKCQRRGSRLVCSNLPPQGQDSLQRPTGSKISFSKLKLNEEARGFVNILASGSRLAHAAFARRDSDHILPSLDWPLL